MQAGVRIPESQTQGISKIGVGEKTNQSQCQEVSNIKKTKTSTHKGSRKQGGGEQNRTKTSRKYKYKTYRQHAGTPDRE